MSVLEPERTTAFFNCWVRKEAFVKALGAGLSVPLHSFRVSLAPSHTPELLHVRDKADEAGLGHSRVLASAELFRSCGCQRFPMQVQIHRVDIREIFASGGFF